MEGAFCTLVVNGFVNLIFVMVSRLTARRGAWFAAKPIAVLASCAGLTCSSVRHQASISWLPPDRLVDDS